MLLIAEIRYPDFNALRLGRLIAACVLLLWLCVGFVRGDGGTVRLSERQGPYQVTVFTSPAPLRAGPVDVSVLVLDPATQKPVADVAILIRGELEGQPGTDFEQPATASSATNKLLQSAQFELPAAGTWQMEVVVSGPRGEARSRFTAEALGPVPRWIELMPWIVWPLGVVLLFGIHQWLLRKARQPGH